MSIDETLEHGWNNMLIKQVDTEATKFFFAMDGFSRAEERIRICLKSINTLPSLFSCAANTNRKIVSSDLEDIALDTSMELAGFYDRDEKAGDYFRSQVELNFMNIETHWLKMEQSLGDLKECVDDNARPIPGAYREKMAEVVSMWESTLENCKGRSEALMRRFDAEKLDGIDFSKPHGYSHDENRQVTFHDTDGLQVDSSVSDFLRHIAANTL